MSYFGSDLQINVVTRVANSDEDLNSLVLETVNLLLNFLHLVEKLDGTGLS